MAGNLSLTTLPDLSFIDQKHSSSYGYVATAHEYADKCISSSVAQEQKLIRIICISYGSK